MIEIEVYVYISCDKCGQAAETIHRTMYPGDKITEEDVPHEWNILNGKHYCPRHKIEIKGG